MERNELKRQVDQKDGIPGTITFSKWCLAFCLPASVLLWTWAILGARSQDDGLAMWHVWGLMGVFVILLVASAAQEAKPHSKKQSYLNAILDPKEKVVDSRFDMPSK